MTKSSLGAVSVEWMGVQYRTTLASADTNGAIAIFESISPLGSGPPRHIHQAEDEVFFLLSGTCEFWTEGTTFTRSASEAVFVPRGASHTFRVIGTTDCHHLTILTPGGFEGFFAEMAKAKFQIPDDMAQISEAAARFNLSFTGPPL